MAKDNSYNISFNSETWSTPNTYDVNFKPFPTSPGIYIITHFDFLTKHHEMLYIGSAKNIALRLRSHEVLRMLSNFYYYLPVFFIEHYEYRAVEKYLIKKYHPKFNRQHNG